MKYKQYYLFFVVILLVGGCDFLKYDKNTIVTKDLVFHSTVRTKEFLNNIYGQMPAGFNDVGAAMRASATDNAEESNTVANIQKINDGSWNAIQTVDAKWGAFYTGIRAANKFLKNFDMDNYKDRQYNEDYDQIVEQFKYYPFETRFLRALFYFKLIKRYGNVPLITKVLTPEEANSVQPSPYQDVTDFIVAECDSIAPNLPLDYSSVPNKETGRATRGAAMALKARALLYAASPLHNPGKEQQKWIKAAKAANAIIDSLNYTLDSDYTDIFNNLESNEIIWDRRQGSSNYFERDNFPIGYEGTNESGTNPTQNLIDAYEMQSSGQRIEEPSSGYDSSNPYKGRDPRLKETVIVNNSIWKDRKVQIWKDGKDGQPKTGATKTGYYLKKYVEEGVNLAAENPTTQRHDWVVFRYGGILLDYAEAMNEAYGPDNAAGMGMTARQAVNKIRERSNMPDFPPGMSKAAFRKKEHNERRVEMAFENQRFWDIRRWKIGPSTTVIEQMIITQQSPGSFNYEKKELENRVWSDKMYLYPIPQSEIFKNEALEQNPGW